MTSTATGTGTATVIQTDALSVFYGDVQALQATTIGFERGRVSALIGASGSGKSTFLRSLNRMHDMTPGARVQGRVLFDGADIYGAATDPVILRSRIGMVFQRPNPFPKTIYENVVYGPKIHGHRGASLKDIAERALTEAALFDEVKDRLGTSALSLSGGQQQRLCIARALAIDPDVLLMDEPASALDPIATAKIEDLIASLRERLSIIIVTHSMQQAARISDTTAFFHLGRLVESGPTNDIFARPAQKQTADYISGRFG